MRMPDFSARCRLPDGISRLLFLFVLALPNAYGEAPVLTLEDAHALAERNNPTLKQALSEIDAIEGRRRDARALLYHNPTLFTDLTRRRAPDGSNREWAFGVEQPFELAGQPRLRRAATESDLADLRASIESLRLTLRAEVERRYLQVQAVQARLAIEEEALSLIERAAGIVRRRVSAGEDTRLEGNLAEVEVGRMRNELERLREELVETQSELATVLQLPAEVLPQVEAGLDVTPLPYTLPELVEAGQRRQTLVALAHREEADRNRLELERAARYPDLTIGLSAAREGPAAVGDTITTLTFSLPLPLFKRNAEGIGRAYADLAQTRIEREAAKRNIRADIEAFWMRLQNLGVRLQRLNDVVLPRLDENMRLAQISYRSGEISISELLLAMRQVVDARRDIFEATIERELTRVALEESAGWSRPSTAP